uniref:hypothetical protein n=1 Tax=Parerythrobacter lutipelagi TaxID=1964208 RepID=UPI0010F93494|nr:hypothetical protein [Parerythrobacter lutipelagi]
MRTLTKIALCFLTAEITSLVFVSIARPEYDGNNLSALIFWLAYFHVFLLVAVVLFAIVIVQGIKRGS